MCPNQGDAEREEGDRPTDRRPCDHGGRDWGPRMLEEAGRAHPWSPWRECGPAGIQMLTSGSRLWDRVTPTGVWALVTLAQEASPVLRARSAGMAKSRRVFSYVAQALSERCSPSPGVSGIKMNST